MESDILTDDKDETKREQDGFDDFKNEQPKEATNASEVATAALPALKGMLSEYTILPVKATEEEKRAGLANPSLLPLVGGLIGLVIIILIKVVEVLEESLGIMMGPFFAILILALPIILFRFKFFGSMVRFGHALFPESSENTGVPVAGIGLSIFAIGGSMILYVMLAGFIGTFFLGLIAAIVEICVLNALASANAWANGKVINVVSLVVTLICTVVASLVWMAIHGNIVTEIIIAAVIISILSTLCGIVVAAISKKKLGEVTTDAIGASAELSRLWIIGFTIVSVMLL